MSTDTMARPMASIADAEDWMKTIRFYDGTALTPSTSGFVQAVVLIDIAKSLRILSGRIEP